MNKARSKALKGLADILPDAYIQRQHTESGRLYEFHKLIDEGHTFTTKLPQLNELNKDDVFSMKYNAFEILNHHKRLKAAWKNKGTVGIQEYLVWLKGHNERWVKLNNEHKVKELDEGLYKLAIAKAGSFWSSLIAFLFSFAMMFSKEKAAKRIREEIDKKAIDELIKSKK